MITYGIKKDDLIFIQDGVTLEFLQKYNYQIISLEQENVDYLDFDYVNGVFYFNFDKYKKRLEEEKQNLYKTTIRRKIHKKYSIDDEIALQNNFITSPEKYGTEYQEYQNYREQCKREAKIELGII